MKNTELRERTAAGLRRMTIAEHDSLKGFILTGDYEYLESGLLLNYPVFYAESIQQTLTDNECPVIPLFSKEENLGLAIKFTKGFLDER